MAIKHYLHEATPRPGYRVSWCGIEIERAKEKYSPENLPYTRILERSTCPQCVQSHSEYLEARKLRKLEIEAEKKRSRRDWKEKKKTAFHWTDGPMVV